MTLRDWLVDHPPPDSAYTQSAAHVARRAIAGEPFLRCVRDLLDEWQLMVFPALKARAIQDEPEPTGDARYDAYLGALVEHLAGRDELTRPPWTTDRDRFLDRFWFVSEVKGFRAVLIACSPAAFRRRGIFVDPTSLLRC